MLAPISLGLLAVGVVGLWLGGVVVVLSLLYAFGERQQRLRTDAE